MGMGWKILWGILSDGLRCSHPRVWGGVLAMFIWFCELLIPGTCQCHGLDEKYNI